MRPSATLTALWSLAAGSTHRGHVFLIDADTSLSTARLDTIDPPTARLIFAQRLGLSPFYDIGHVDEDAIRRINAFGGCHEQLLGRDAGSSTPSRVFIVVDGVEKPLDLVPASPLLSFFDLDPAPHPSQSSQLVSEFLSYDDQLLDPAAINGPVEQALKPI